ncbi:hypothetical protein IAE19_08250 [Acinetobacter sp. S40]|uniref:hypothetical protein n=1 Tax=unclassified Acinetobacter TaxID=196816 RepID=UPI001909FE2C|nr:MULTISPECIES: hypothetical protein [unclassified Acinetobacter]MBJ9985433.1 hypothetical protein [Acinetobacter sp. S40]MBK0063783.1 hypothetical protein [Acinetobacter sp. S55]MBK0066928.1 hypothetical protein [Acinetobacter sp. S54]
MGFHKIIFRIFIVWDITYLPYAYAYDFFAENSSTQVAEVEYSPENTDLNQIQKHLAEQHEQEENNYEILKNPFYSNERINIYNYTAYNADSLKNKMINGGSEHISANDLSISFGYGMTYKINTQHKVGYEYISSFPYDRGQLIRIFWIWSF